MLFNQSQYCKGKATSKQSLAVAVAQTGQWYEALHNNVPGTGPHTHTRTHSSMCRQDCILRVCTAPAPGMEGSSSLHDVYCASVKLNTQCTVCMLEHMQDVFVH